MLLCYRVFTVHGISAVSRWMTVPNFPQVLWGGVFLWRPQTPMNSLSFFQSATTPRDEKLPEKSSLLCVYYTIALGVCQGFFRIYFRFFDSVLENVHIELGTAFPTHENYLVGEICFLFVVQVGFYGNFADDLGEADEVDS